jgi:dUTP pyrophosphatase
MEKREIEEMLNRLKEIDEQLNNEEGDIDEKIFDDINSIVNKLGNTVKSETLSEDSFFLNVGVKKLHRTAVIPEYAKYGDAGLDLTATRILSDTEYKITYGTDIALEIPYGYVGLLFPRSSIRKYNIELSNSVGVIDAGYRGEIQLTFDKFKNAESKCYNVGDKIGQVVIMPFPKIKFIEKNELTDSDRGEGGFGHTGN